MSLLNTLLKRSGFETLNQLKKALINGTFPHISEDKQISNLSENADNGSLKPSLEGGSNTDFYMKVNLQDLHYVKND